MVCSKISRHSFLCPIFPLLSSFRRLIENQGSECSVKDSDLQNSDIACGVVMFEDFRWRELPVLLSITSVCCQLAHGPRPISQRNTGGRVQFQASAAPCSLTERWFAGTIRINQCFKPITLAAHAIIDRTSSTGKWWQAVDPVGDDLRCRAAYKGHVLAAPGLCRKCRVITGKRRHPLNRIEPGAIRAVRGMRS